MSFNKLKAQWSNYQSSKDGSAAIVFAITLPVLIGMIAFSVEVGHYRQNNAKVQSIADMAAMAAALEYDLTQNRENAKFAATGDAITNGFKSSDGTILIETPIKSGDFSGREGVVVRIKQKQKRYFSNIFSYDKDIIHTAEATVLSAGGGQPICVLALSQTASPALTITGNTDVLMENCGLHSNSTASPSFSNGGSGTLTADCVSASGEVSTAGGLVLNNCDAPETNQPVMTDPYADIDVPAGVAGMTCLKPSYPGNKAMNLVPGRYCGKNLGPMGVMTFTQPGVYIFDSISIYPKSGATIVGSGVTLIFMNGGHIDNNNGGQMDLTAPTSGTYSGILMYSDRNTSDASKILRFNGNQSAKLEGVLYFPKQKVDFRGGADILSNCTNIIADTVEFSGNSAVTNTGCAEAGAQTISAGGGNEGILLVR